MTISLEAAEQLGNMTVFGFGFGLVFVGLICIILICSIMGALCQRFIKSEKSEPVVANKPVATVPQSANVENKGEFIAAVSAVIAEELGTDVTGIRVISVKKL